MVGRAIRIYRIAASTSSLPPQIFDGRTLEREDTRRDYGERRVIAIGMADGIALTVVYTDRAEAAGGVIRRIISARKSHRHEREAYRNAISPK